MAAERANRLRGGGRGLAEVGTGDQGARLICLGIGDSNLGVSVEAFRSG
jgi:hypothetical protein